MNIGDILKKVGGTILRDAVPGGGLILDVVNTFLPDDKKLPANATADQAKSAIESLPPEQQAAVLTKQLDVQIESIKSWTDITESLAKVDASGSSTRPKIALMMAWVVVLAALIPVVSWAIALHKEDAATLKVIIDSWPFILAVLGTPTALLRAYFGMRTAEKKARYNMANGHPTMGVLGAITNRVLGSSGSS